jgi:hypothetical protein
MIGGRHRGAAVIACDGDPPALAPAAVPPVINIRSEPG